jgi:hypothetical protein
MEGRMSLGEVIDLDSYGRASSHLRRILESLGLERRARDVSPSLDDICEDLDARGLIPFLLSADCLALVSGRWRRGRHG